VITVILVLSVHVPGHVTGSLLLRQVLNFGWLNKTNSSI